MKARRMIGLALMAMAISPGYATTSNSTVISYRWSTKGLMVPKGSVYLIGLDKDNLRSLAPFGKDQRNKTAGLDPIMGNVAASDLALDISIEPPTRNEGSDVGRERRRWQIIINASWQERRQEGPRASGKDDIKTTVTWTSKGSIGLTYNEEAAHEWRWETVKTKDGKELEKEIWHSTEQAIPIKMENIPTGIEGLRLERVAYASSNGTTQSLVVFIANTIEILSKHVRVSESNPKFKWDAKWFAPLGESPSDKANTIK